MSEVQAAFLHVCVCIFCIRLMLHACGGASEPILSPPPPFLFFCVFFFAATQIVMVLDPPLHVAVATLRRFNVSLKSKIQYGQILKLPP